MSDQKNNLEDIKYIANFMIDSITRNPRYSTDYFRRLGPLLFDLSDANIIELKKRSQIKLRPVIFSLELVQAADRMIYNHSRLAQFGLYGEGGPYLIKDYGHPFIVGGKITIDSVPGRADDAGVFTFKLDVDADEGG